MDREQLKEMMGLTVGGTVSLKLNEVSLNGDTGKFNLIDLIGGKNEDNKYNVVELGDAIVGVILKMRWRYFKLTPRGDQYDVTSSSEYDNKHTDEVIIFGKDDKGLAKEMKEKYELGTQRIVYTYLPDRKEVVRLVVKSSALDGEKNPNGELGLFEYQREFEELQELPIDYITQFDRVQRTGRVNYYAMTFNKGRVLTEGERGKCVELLTDIHGKTKSVKVVTEQQIESVENRPEATTVPTHLADDIDPADIPF